MQGKKFNSEISEQHGTTWNHAEIEFPTFIQVRIFVLWRQNWGCVRNGWDWKNDAESPKDLLPLRDFNKKPNCLLRSQHALTFILFYIESEKKHTIQEVWASGFNLFTKFIEVMIGLFYKIQSTQTLYLTKSDWKQIFFITACSALLILLSFLNVRNCKAPFQRLAVGL